MYGCEDAYDLVECVEDELVRTEDGDARAEACEDEDDALDDCIVRESSLDDD